MKFLTLHTSISYLVAGLGLLALTLGSDLSPSSSVLFGIGYFASLGVPPKVRNRSRFIAVWNALLLVFLMTQVLRGILGHPALALGLEFAGFLQISRLFHRRNARDHQHIQALAFLHLIAATVLSTEIEYAFIFFGFVLATPWMLALTHLRAEIEIHIGESIDNPGPRAHRLLQSKNIAGSGFLFGTAALALPLFFVTATFFLLFPRVGMGFLSMGETNGRNVAGFGGDVQLGNFGVIRNDSTVVMRVRPDELSTDPPKRAYFRFRGTSFDHYEAARWTRTMVLPERIQPRFGYYVLTRDPNGENEKSIDIHLDPLDEPVVFVPDGAIALKVPPRIENSLDVHRKLDLRPGLDLRYADGDGLPLRYTAIVAEDMRGGFPEPLNAEERTHYLQLPDDLNIERVTALAREKAGQGSPEEQAQRLESWLRASGEFQYSLTMPDTQGRNPLEVFLFEAKYGHCEYFATALAILLRTLEIPTRNVTGFFGGSWNEYGDYYAISQSDAHSWVEMYLNGTWIVLEPTPPSRSEMGSRPMLGRLRDFFDALRTRWSEDVVGYDLRQQVSGLREAFRWFRSFRNENDSDRASPSRNSDSRFTPNFYFVVVIIVFCGFLLWLWRRHTFTKKPDEQQKAASLYAELEQALRKQGYPRAPGTTPNEHAQNVAQSGFAAADAVAEVTSAYLAARFGESPLNLEYLRTRIREIRKETRPRNVET